ncbi:MAG: hypothetical protein AAB340_01015 [Patescibacteria group bacterium]
MKTMPQSTKEEKFRWIKPILDKEISIVNMARVTPFSKSDGVRPRPDPVSYNKKLSAKKEGHT